MKRSQVRVITKSETRYIVDAESSQNALGRVLAGKGEAGDVDYPELDIFAKPLEG